MKRHIAKMALMAALLALSSLTLSACGSVEEAPTRSPYPFLSLSPLPPPAPLPEDKPETDVPMKEVWRKGYWVYDGLDFFWNPGEFLLRPHPTAVWSADRWEKRGFGWAFVPGHWE